MGSCHHRCPAQDTHSLPQRQGVACHTSTQPGSSLSHGQRIPLYPEAPGCPAPGSSFCLLKQGQPTATVLLLGALEARGKWNTNCQPQIPHLPKLPLRNEEPKTDTRKENLAILKRMAKGILQKERI